MSISRSKALSLVPFGYFAATRLNGLRDLAYLVATSWLPAIWLLIRLAGLDPAHALLTYIIGYMAFISIYEIGYLANDAWDAGRTSEGRRRLSFGLGWIFVAAFLVLRLGLWTVLGALTGWITDPYWLFGYAALAIAFAQHNLVRDRELRLASFYELATLRFLLPILVPVAVIFLAPALLVALIPYAFPRLLAYMESKQLLSLEGRHAPSFGFFLQLSLAPLLLFCAYLLSAQVLVEILAYFLAIHGLWWATAGLRKPVKAG